MGLSWDFNYGRSYCYHVIGLGNGTIDSGVSLDTYHPFFAASLICPAQETDTYTTYANRNHDPSLLDAVTSGPRTLHYLTGRLKASNGDHLLG